MDLCNQPFQDDFISLVNDYITGNIFVHAASCSSNFNLFWLRVKFKLKHLEDNALYTHH